MNIDSLPRFPLAYLPTPVAELTRLREALAENPAAPGLLIKRDDLTGLAFGGNKTRKLEFLIGDALDRGRDSVVSGGAAQSNHCRQTAAAAAKAGLECHLALAGEEPQNFTGNLLLDRILGAKFHWCGEFRKGEKIPEIVEGLRSAGRKPYLIPYGGSNSVGAVGYVQAMREFAEQMKWQNLKVTHIVFASSSCGTQSGMTLGARLFCPDVKIVGIRIDKEELDISFEDQLVQLANDTAKRINVKESFDTSDFLVRDQYLGGGYGVVGDLERNAIQMLGESEGIILDPVYTSRAFGGMLDMIQTGYFSRSDTVLFWHTGGGPAIFTGSI